jgi:hypothetical protein
MRFHAASTTGAGQVLPTPVRRYARHNCFHRVGVMFVSSIDCCGCQAPAHLQECCGHAGTSVCLSWQNAGVILELVAIVVPAKISLVPATWSRGMVIYMSRQHAACFFRQHTPTLQAGCCYGTGQEPGNCTYSSWLLVGRDLAARGVCETIVLRAVCLVGPDDSRYSSSLLASPRA